MRSTREIILLLLTGSVVITICAAAIKAAITPPDQITDHAREILSNTISMILGIVSGYALTKTDPKP